MAMLPMTHEVMEDAPYMAATLEMLFAPRPEPTPAQRITGWRSFTASNGITIRERFGWRLEKWLAEHPPEPEAECDCSCSCHEDD